MRSKQVVALGLLLLSLSLLLTSVPPTSMEPVEVAFTTSSGTTGLLWYTLPAKVYAGDKGGIYVKLDPEETPGLSPQSITVHVEAGFEYMVPAGIVNVNIRNTEPLDLEWVFRTAKNAVYPGTLWIWGDNGEVQELLLAKDFQVVSGYYLGAPIARMRIIFGILTALSLFWLFHVNIKKSGII